MEGLRITSRGEKVVFEIDEHHGSELLVTIRDFNAIAGMYLDKEDATKLRDWLTEFIGT